MQMPTWFPLKLCNYIAAKDGGGEDLLLHLLAGSSGSRGNTHSMTSGVCYSTLVVLAARWRRTSVSSFRVRSSSRWTMPDLKFVPSSLWTPFYWIHASTSCFKSLNWLCCHGVEFKTSWLRYHIKFMHQPLLQKSKLICVGRVLNSILVGSDTILN